MHRSNCIIAGCFAVLLLACKAAPGKETLLAYARAAGAYASGDFEAAAVGARECLVHTRNFLPAAMLLGKISYFAGDDAKAMTSLEQAVRLSPRSGDASLWLSRTYRAAGMDTEARRACELLLTADPQHIAGLRLAAALALDSDDIATATAYLDRAVESAGEAGLVFADRAALRWAAGDVSGAQADLASALATLPAGSAARQATGELLSRITEAGK